MLFALSLALCSQVGAFPEVPRLEEDARDVMETADGKRHAGRLLERFPGRRVVMLEGGHRCEYDPEEVAQFERTVREREEGWFARRKEDPSVDEAWKLALNALDLELYGLARAQCYAVLLLDPGHEGAHLALGHKLQGKRWRVFVKPRWVDWDDFLEDAFDAKKGFSIETENYVVWGDVGVRKTLDAAFDLELLYLEWMKTFGNDLLSTETVDVQVEKMAVAIFASDRDPGFKSNKMVKARHPDAFYDPQANTTILVDYNNSAFTFLDPNDYRPVRLFDVAAQQLLYSTLVLSRLKGGLAVGPADPTRTPEGSVPKPDPGEPKDQGPGTGGNDPSGGDPSQGDPTQPDPTVDPTQSDPTLAPQAGDTPNEDLVAFAHWAELGLGAYFQQSFGGRPGYARAHSLLIPPQWARDARDDLYNERRPVGTYKSNDLEGLTLLTGLQSQDFYTSRPDVGLLARCRARMLVIFLLEEPPNFPAPGLRLREGFLQYLRVTYTEANGHSSQTLDESLGGPFENVLRPWLDWLRGF